MGRNDRPAGERSYDPLSAQRALTQILPALERVATSPEKFSAKERSTIVELLKAALSFDNAKLSIRASEIGMVMAEENLRQGRQVWPTHV